MHLSGQGPFFGSGKIFFALTHVYALVYDHQQELMEAWQMQVWTCLDQGGLAQHQDEWMIIYSSEFSESTLQVIMKRSGCGMKILLNGVSIMTKEERGLEDTCSMMEHWKNSMKTAVF
jgi:hypothetical protein